MRVIITGATGMAGEGVLHECLDHPDVDAILLLVRRPSGVVHRKVTEIIHSDFHDMRPVAGRLAGYDACFFCLGVSSVGMKEAPYKRVTFDLTMHIAHILLEQNPRMRFCYISGAGTDHTEKGRIMWARVKGRTENALLALPFAAVYIFRPGYMHPTPGLRRVPSAYRYFSWLYPVLRPFFPRYMGTLTELGLAMISVCQHGFPRQILEVKDIRLAARQQIEL